MGIVTEELKAMEKIKFEYQKIQSKTLFIIELAESVGRAKGTIRNHWFGGFWEIPLEYQEKVLELITNKIKNQNHEKSI
jgi:hypothetical protein